MFNAFFDTIADMVVNFVVWLAGIGDSENDNPDDWVV